jgi:hypothetical protein
LRFYFIVFGSPACLLLRLPVFLAHLIEAYLKNQDLYLLLTGSCACSTCSSKGGWGFASGEIFDFRAGSITTAFLWPLLTSV